MNSLYNRNFFHSFLHPRKCVVYFFNENFMTLIKICSDKTPAQYRSLQKKYNARQLRLSVYKVRMSNISTINE